MKATVDWNTRRAVFSGPGTFEAKERLKTLGAHRWLAATRSWEILFESLDVEELRKLFPGIAVEEVSTQKSGTELSVGASLPASFSVEELLTSIRSVVMTAFPQPIFVRGVISRLKHVGERVFVELSDQELRDTHLDAAIWSDQATMLQPLRQAGFQLEVDLPVMFQGQVGVRTKDGRLSLTIVGVVPEYTVGKLAAQREVTNEKLRQEGIFAANREKHLPLVPLRLGVLTSAVGTVIHDFIAALEEAHFAFQLFWLPVAVQGAGARDGLLQGLQQLQACDNLDAILLFRGGGSPAELALFNDYQLARAIALCPLPVISAIGHQEDQCSVQDVSFRGGGVPKDVGRFLAEQLLQVRRRLTEYGNQMATQVSVRIERAEVGLHKQLLCLQNGAQQCISEREHTFLGLGRALWPLALHRCQHEERRVRERVASLAAQSRATTLRAQQLLTQIGPAIIRLTHSRVSEQILRLQQMGRNIVSGVGRSLEDAQQPLRRFPLIVGQCLQRCAQAEDRLQGYDQLVQGARPESQLARGFALVRREGIEGFVLESARLGSDEQIVIQFRDGERKARTE